MNKKTRANLEIILSIMVIFICLGLSLKLYLESDNYECSKCEVEFRWTQPIIKEDRQEMSVKLVDIYEVYIEGECPIVFNKKMGFINGGGYRWEK